MNKIIYVVFFSLVVLFTYSCVSLKYSDDLLSIGSASANSPEFPVMIHGKYCRDLEGTVGFCAVRHKRSEDLKIVLTPQQYAYNLEFDCTNAVQPITQVYSVPAETQDFTLTLTSAQMLPVNAFSCTVKISPLDRPEPIASTSRISIVLVAADYIPLAQPTQMGDNFVFGENALYTRYLDDSGWHEVKKMTYTKSKTIQVALVESYGGRHGVFMR